MHRPQPRPRPEPSRMAVSHPSVGHLEPSVGRQEPSVGRLEHVCLWMWIDLCTNSFDRSWLSDPSCTHVRMTPTGTADTRAALREMMAVLAGLPAASDEAEAIKAFR